MTPYEKIRFLHSPGQYLAPGITLKQLDAFTHQITDNETADQLNSAKDKRSQKQFDRRIKPTIFQVPF